MSSAVCVKSRLRAFRLLLPKRTLTRTLTRPLLFEIYVNDLEGNVAGLISKFADDTEIGGVADTDEDCQRMQQDIDW